jgi:protein PhnA
VRDAFGNLLADGDSVTVVKDLKVRGASAVTKIRNIRIASGDHDIGSRSTASAACR